MGDRLEGEMSGIPHPITCMVDGKRWDLYTADYETPDGKFGFYFYAISAEHAELILTDLKATATLSGKVEGVYKA